MESIHTKLAKSYLSYFVFSIVGLFIDTLIGFDINIKNAEPIALACFVVGSILMAWAQYTSSHHTKEWAKSTSLYFYRGPYRFMRNPTHLGIVLLVTGYTLVSGSLVFFGITIIGYTISNIFFQKYEAILDRTYGKEYQNYKAKVPKIL